MASKSVMETYTKLTNGSHQAFENTSTSVAASQMRNALNNLTDTVKDPKEKKVSTARFPSANQISDVFAAFRDRDGQLLCSLPPLLERQGEE